MDDGFEIDYDRQLRAAVVAISKSKIPKGSFQRYKQMSDDIIEKMMKKLYEKTADPIALSFNAGSWVRSGPFHIKAFVTPDKFCDLLEADGEKLPEKRQKEELKRRHSKLTVREVAAKFSDSPTLVAFETEGTECLRLSDKVECSFSYLKLCPAKPCKEIRGAVETFEKEWFAKQPQDGGSGWDGFGVYLIPASKSAEKWDVFVNIDPGQYKRIFPKANAAHEAYEEPERKYRKKC